MDRPGVAGGFPSIASYDPWASVAPDGAGACAGPRTGAGGSTATGPTRPRRASAFFGDGIVPADADMFDHRHVPTDLPGDAEAAVAFLERSYRRWHDGIAALDEEGLRRPLGPTGGPYATDPMAALIAHINREAMHHGAEIGLLRDLYRATGATSRHSRLVPRRP